MNDRHRYAPVDLIWKLDPNAALAILALERDEMWRSIHVQDFAGSIAQVSARDALRVARRIPLAYYQSRR